MGKNDVLIKDKNIRIFREKYSEDGIVKKYIHPKDTYLKAHIRQVSANEAASNDAIQDVSDIQFTINYREVEIDMLIEFKDKIYQITSVDRYEFYKKDLKIIATEINQREYNGYEWS